MPNNFSEVMSRNSTVQLLKIINDEREDYNPEAVKAAEEELASRNLSSEQVELAQTELTQIRKIATDRANEPLEVGYILLTFLMPGFLWLFLSNALKGEGYYRKSKELAKWSKYVWLGYFLLFILMIIFIVLS